MEKIKNHIENLRKTSKEHAMFSIFNFVLGLIAYLVYQNLWGRITVILASLTGIYYLYLSIKTFKESKRFAELYTLLRRFQIGDEKNGK